jgi:hypothetical protein
MFRLRLPFFLSGVLILSQGCGGGDAPTTPSPPTPVATSITLSQTSVTIETIGNTAQLAATVKDQTGTVMAGKAITWASSDADMVSVSPSGLVTAISPGTANITATHLTLSATASVIVQDGGAPEVLEISWDLLDVTFEPGVLELWGSTTVGIVVQDDYELEKIRVSLVHDGVDLELASAEFADDTNEGLYTFDWLTYETTSVGGIDTLVVQVWDTSGNEGIGAQEIVLMHQPVVTVTNQLLQPVKISFTDQNGNPYASWPGANKGSPFTGQTNTLLKSHAVENRWAFLSTDSVRMTWAAQREQIGTSGSYYGESIGSIFSLPRGRDPSADLTYTIDNKYAGKTFYYLQFSNPTDYEAVPFIDPGIVGEINVCRVFTSYQCSVAPGAVEMGLGYYELKTSSIIGYKRLTGGAWGTVGGLHYWDHASFSGAVQSGSGAVSLTISW